MKKIIVITFFITLTATSFAFMQKSSSDQPLTKALHSTGMKIIDIRTKPEWKQTGIVKDSYTLTFFDEKGNYNIENFVSKLSTIVKPTETFAIICRTGRRTATVAEFLRKIGFTKVINIKGGIKKAYKNGVEFERYSR